MYRVELPGERKRKSPDKIREDLYKAKDILFLAFEAEDEEEVAKLLQKSLNQSPLCAEAYLFYLDMLGFHHPAKLGILRIALWVAEQALTEPLSSFDGMFWGDVDTRPYMRVKFALADCLWASGHYEDALTEYASLIELNPNDNQGARYKLSAYYLELERIEQLKQLFEQYNDDPCPFILYNKVLLAYKTKKGKTTDKLALTAIKYNPFVVRYLADRIMPEENQTGYYTAGGEDEAEEYVCDNLRSWLRTPNAIEWLVDLAERNGLFYE